LATHKSAEKRARQSLRRTARNANTKSSVRTSEKKVRVAIAAGDAKGATALLVEFQSKIGKASAKGVVHAKAAARKVGRLAGHVSKLAGAKA
jgi:small subunit ribosomal protein S20